MEKSKAKKILLQEGRMCYGVSVAKEICKVFKVEFDEKLIRTTKGYRENITYVKDGIADGTIPRVNICDLSEFICNKLNKKPDEKTLECSYKMHGVGSGMDLLSEAYAKNL